MAFLFTQIVFSCTQEQDLRISQDELHLIRTFIEGELAGKSTFDNQPLEMDWKNAVVTKEHYEIPLLSPLLGFVPKYQDVETRLLVPNRNMEEYSFMTLDTEEIIGGLSFIELTSDPDKISLETYRHMNFSKDLQPGDFVYKRATASDPNAYMPVQCEPATIIYYEKDCYIIASTLVNCSEWREVERVEIEICGPDGIIGGNNYTVRSIDNNVTEPCIKAAVDNAIDADFKNEITQLVNDVFGESESFDILISDVTGLPESTDGETIPSGPGQYLTFQIELNKDVLENASREYISATVFHELLHAYLGYCDINASTNDSDHQEMATNYLNSLSSALIDQYGISNTDATNLAWGGLQGTAAWGDLSSTKITQISNTNQQYRSGSKGTKCN